MTFFAKYEKDGTVHAGPMNDGMTYFGITEASCFWRDVEAWVKAGNIIAPYVEPEVISAPQSSYVEAMDLWSRLTNEEADAVESAMDSQPFRNRKIFETAKTFRDDHELWPLLESMAVALFGEERAAEILAPSNPVSVDRPTV